ncbi:MAG: tetratricopeptide repeat protein, partial [Microbacteriaceae bacterium]|nr:tetratricopeptide repeat protein [Microbacteriaceae bacterium]
LVAVLLFAGTLFPALGFFDIFPMRYSFVADHFQYLASIPLLVLMVAAVHTLSQRMGLEMRPLTNGAAGLVLLILLGMTWQQARVYGDPETLWRDTLQKNPACSMAHHNLGNVLREQGRLAEASLEFRTVLQIDGRDNHARLNLANVLSEQGRFQDALQQYRQILQTEPRHVSARYNLGNALDALQQTEAAEIQFRQVLEIDPQHPLARLNLAVLLMQKGQWEEARLQLLELLRTEPEYSLVHYNLASVYHHERNRQLAVFHAREALRLAPDSLETQVLLQQIQNDEVRTRPNSP